MQSIDLPRFKHLLTGIGALYGNPMPEILLDIWWNALEKIAFENIKKALESHVVHPDKGQFMPKPADVIEHLEGSTESQALKAWSLVAKAIREVGAYSSVIFPDVRIHAVIRDMGGWIALCQSKRVDLPFRAREFEKRYQAMVQHPPADCPHQLTGFLEQQNRLDGYLPPEPIRIGENIQPTLLETL